MLSWIHVVILGVSSVVGETPPGLKPSQVAGPEGSLYSRNLFGEWLGKDEAAIDARLDEFWQQLFYGDPENERLYYPVGEDEAYMWDVASDDVRSEGQSYGMMIAVQLGHKEEFDRLWRWTKRHMYHAEGPRQGYYAWQCRTDGSHIDPGSASDGELWFAMTLLMASARWGDGEGILDYRAQANEVLDAMLNADRDHEEITSIFCLEYHLIRFVPLMEWAEVSDPSYNLPHFLEIFALQADNNREFWKAAADASRELLRRSAHPETGLMPDYCWFDGTPRVGGGHEDFRFDAWRTLANVALDAVFFDKDPWQYEQSQRVLSFMRPFEEALPNQMTLDGKSLSKDFSPGLHAMAAVAAMAADREIGEYFVERLWEMTVPAGYYRYYDGLMVMFGMIKASGRFWLPTGECAMP